MNERDKNKKYPKVNEDFVDEDIEESKAKDTRFSRELKDINITQLVFTGLITITCTIIMTFLGILIDSKVQSAVIESKLEDINSDIDNLEALVSTQVVELKNMISSEDIKIDALNESVSVLKYIHDIAEVIDPDPSLVKHSTVLVGNTPLTKQMARISANETIAKNVVTGEEIKASLYVNRPIAFFYTDSETGDLVFFKGQYDENGYWTGNCIINKYNNNKLVMIMDAEYDDSGMLLSYKMVQPIVNDKDNNDDGENDPLWLISERKVQDDVNMGETWTYFREESYEMKFSVDSFSDEDIVTKDDFCDEMLDNLQLEGYYHGNTSNGLYNDLTGEACMVKYTPDGYIRTFYVGNVVNGDFNDSTGTAWYVALTHNKEHYTYYNGIFSNGRPGSDLPNYKTQEEIDEIVAGYGFNFEPNWKQFD